MRALWCRVVGHRWTPYRLYGGDLGYSYLCYFQVYRCSRCKAWPTNRVVRLLGWLR